MSTKCCVVNCNADADYFIVAYGPICHHHLECHLSVYEVKGKVYSIQEWERPRGETDE
jgi:hypothetical protein